MRKFIGFQSIFSMEGLESGLKTLETGLCLAIDIGELLSHFGEMSKEIFVLFPLLQSLRKRLGKKLPIIHRHFIDDLIFEEDGEIFRRVPEVFDCWFESGSMPYAQNHYPFENKSETMDAFPADFIAEGLDQTRGWFYTLTVLAAALFDKPAFKNVIVNGILLAEDGSKNVQTAQKLSRA